jgi:hypothetical protein
VPRFHERRSLNYSAGRQDKMKPKLAAFPKCYMGELCVHRTIPMLCCSPDFTEPAADLLAQQITRERRMIEITRTG